MKIYRRLPERGYPRISNSFYFLIRKSLLVLKNDGTCIRSNFNVKDLDHVDYQFIGDLDEA